MNMSNAPDSQREDRIVSMELATLRAHPENAVVFGDPEEEDTFEVLRSELKCNGQWEPLVVRPDGTILAGHLRCRAMQANGETHAFCRVMDFSSYRDEVAFVIKSNTLRRQLSKQQIAFAYARLKRLPREEGGLKRKRGRKPKGDKPTGVIPDLGPELTEAREEATRVLGVGMKEADAMEAVFVAPKATPNDSSVSASADVPSELKLAVKSGSLSPTAAARQVRAERKRQGGAIRDPGPLQAWVEAAASNEPSDDRTPHEVRIDEEASRFRADLAELLSLYQKLDGLLTRRPLKSVIGATEHQRFASLIRDFALRASVELESVQGSESLGRQLQLSVIDGGKS